MGCAFLFSHAEKMALHAQKRLRQKPRQELEEKFRKTSLTEKNSSFSLHFTVNLKAKLNKTACQH